MEPEVPKEPCRGRLATALSCVALTMATGILGMAASSAAELNPHDMILLDRLPWGLNASSAAHLQAVGTERWLAEQLHPAPNIPLPDGVGSQIEAMADVHKFPFDIAVAFEQQAKSANQVADPDQRKAAQQVYQQAMNDRAKQAAARTMLRYLDNTDNAAGHLNENYAREIMELHTMGVGSGYTQADVEALARILTGVGIDLKPEDPKLNPEQRSKLVREGAFEFNPARHDFGDKTFLGHAIKGRGLAEVDEAIDILVRHPATATHLSRQIATYFVSDNPPEPLVQRMAQTFKTTDGDIAAVLATMVHAPEFAASLKPGARFKDPVHYVFSAIRLAYDDKVILNTQPVQNWLNRLGEG